MKVTIQRTANETITIEGSPEEVQRVIDGTLPDPTKPDFNDDRRYIESGRVGDYGEREFVNVRTRP